MHYPRHSQNAILFACAAILTSCGSGLDPRVQRMIEQIEQADARIESVELDCRTAVQSFTKMAQQNDPGLKESSRHFYKRKGVKETLRVVNRQNGRRETLWTVDGETAGLYENPGYPPEAVVGREPEKLTNLPWFVPLPRHVSPSPLSPGLVEALRAGRAQIVEESVEVDGNDTVALEGQYKKHSVTVRFKVYLDPKLDYAPRQIDYLKEDGAIRTRTELKDYEEVEPGIWIPFTAIRTSFNPVTGKKSNLNRITVDRAAVNEPIPHKAFVPSFPPNATVTDESRP